MSASMLFSRPAESVTANLKAQSLPVNPGIHSVSKSLKYLISSFPTMKTVAYTHLPDTIWRPLFIGTVANPQGVVADPLNARLFVSDPDLKRIFWYQLLIESDGLLKTDGRQHVAVDGVTANWLSVDGLGDLYFTGQMIVEAPASSYRSIYRMDADKIASGNALNPVEVYSRSNSGYPNPRTWMPSGIGVDSFNIYWGNQEQGTKYGSVCLGTRQNIGVTDAMEINVVNQAMNEVRGVALAGQSVFYLGPKGVYGAAKGISGAATTDPNIGFIQGGPNGDGWDPTSIAFDGENTMYWTEAKAGIIYQLPAADTNPKPINKYIDAPLVYGVTIFAMTGENPKTTHKDYGMLQSSAVADESDAPLARHLSLWAVMVVAALPDLLA